jgi:hypothetical protein
MFARRPNGALRCALPRSSGARVHLRARRAGNARAPAPGSTERANEARLGRGERDRRLRALRARRGFSRASGGRARRSARRGSSRSCSCGARGARRSYDRCRSSRRVEDAATSPGRSTVRKRSVSFSLPRNGSSRLNLSAHLPAFAREANPPAVRWTAPLKVSFGASFRSFGTAARLGEARFALLEWGSRAHVRTSRSPEGHHERSCRHSRRR